MLGSRPPSRPRLYRPPLSAHGRPISPIDYAWKSVWPYRISAVLGSLILLMAIALIALEIALLAIFESLVGEGVYFTGVGIWTGVFIAAAGVFILILNCVKSVRRWAHVAVIATAIATVFAIIGFSINAKRVQLASFYGAFGSSISQIASIAGLAAAQLALGIVLFLLCLAFIGLYIYVARKVSRRISSRQPQQISYPVRPV